MTTIEQISAKWLVIAAVCSCDRVAVTIMATERCDRGAPAVAEGDHEIVAYGDDWKPLVIDVAAAMAERTGLRPSSCCTTTILTTNAEKTGADASPEAKAKVRAELQMTGDAGELLFKTFVGERDSIR